VVLKSKVHSLAFVICLVGAAVSASFARDQKSASPQGDPVINALNRGVDDIGGTKVNAPTLERRGVRYEIQNSDVLDLQFEFTPDFNQTVTVQPDGFVTLKEIGDLQVQGQTLPQIRDQIERAYGKILAKPVVTIYLKDFNKPYFLAIGQFARPGKYDLRGATTVSAAVAMAGGLTQEAKHSQVLLFRRVNDSWSSVTKIDLKHMLKSRNLSEDVDLHPGDMLYIPQNTISKVKAFIPSPSIGTMAAIP